MNLEFISRPKSEETKNKISESLKKRAIEKRKRDVEKMLTSSPIIL